VLMKVSVFGSGYAGLVQAACFASAGNDVLCVDMDPLRVAHLRRAEVPFFEPGLQELVSNGLESGLLRFGSDPAEAVHHGDFLFITADTPQGDDGAPDLAQVLAVAAQIGEYMVGDRIVVTKSTVPVGTAERVQQVVRGLLAARGVDHQIVVVANPGFLKEGSAVADCQTPDRIIIGSEDPLAIDAMRQLYQPFNRNHEKVLVMDPRSAELTKYAANALLATKISFINEMANLAETVGADIESVRRGMGSDPRLGYHFLYAGCGYGGSCFPKDVRALKHLATSQRVSASILTAVHDTNQRQKNRMTELLLRYFGGDLTGKTFAVWGLAFKPNTDDMSDAPSRYLLEGIWSHGGAVRAYDPKAMPSCAAIYGERADLVLTATKEEALAGADALAICTEWRSFWSPDFAAIRTALKHPVIVDGRNLYDPVRVAEAGLHYFGIGRGESVRRNR
jgi:UDPglucose 6-dehydrogenase